MMVHRHRVALKLAWWLIECETDVASKHLKLAALVHHCRYRQGRTLHLGFVHEFVRRAQLLINPPCAWSNDERSEAAPDGMLRASYIVHASMKTGRNGLCCLFILHLHVNREFVSSQASEDITFSD
jgi:hypothetical protein